ncbi:MAG: cbb3-type cytochrome c oxidase subunit II [Chthoniobacterales bacterium]
MKGLTPLVLGILGTFAFSWVGLALIPNAQIGHLEPQMDEEGTDIYPAPKSGLAERGRRVYAANGCVYCHTQQVRADYAGSDIERKWGTRRSAPRDYIFDKPSLIGRMRIGPDLANVGKRAPVEDAAPADPAATAPTAAAPATGAPPAAPAPSAPPGSDAPPAPAVAVAPLPSGEPLPQGSASSNAAPTTAAGAGVSPAPVAGASPAVAVTAPTAVAKAPGTELTALGVKGEPAAYSAAWHHRHLYDPRSVNGYSIMPSFRFLYEKRKITGERSAEALQFNGVGEPEAGWEIVPTSDATALVSYLMSLDQSHELKEVKSATPPSPAAPGNAAK